MHDSEHVGHCDASATVRPVDTPRAISCTAEAATDDHGLRGVSGTSVEAAAGGSRTGGAVVTVINRKMFKTRWSFEVEVDRERERNDVGVGRTCTVSAAVTARPPKKNTLA